MNYKRKSRRRFFLLMRSRTPPISSEFRGGGVWTPKTTPSVRHWFTVVRGWGMGRRWKCRRWIRPSVSATIDKWILNISFKINVKEIFNYFCLIRFILNYKFILISCSVMLWNSLPSSSLCTKRHNIRHFLSTFYGKVGQKFILIS